MMLVRVFHVLLDCACIASTNGAYYSIGFAIVPETEFYKHILPVVCVEFGSVVHCSRGISPVVLNWSII